MTVAVFSIDNLEHRLKKHLRFGVLRWGVLLGYLESLLGSPRAFVLQMLLVFMARRVLWKSQHFCKEDWFCQCAVRWVHVHSIHEATKHTGLRTCPLAQKGSFKVLGN